MFDFLLDTAAQIRQVPHETISDKLAVGGEVILRGMGTVFAVLILIWILVEFLHLLLGVKTPKTKKKTAAAPAPVAEAVEEAPVVAPSPVADDLALIAVITAAVAAANGSSPSSFRVVSFKRANNKFSSGK